MIKNHVTGWIEGNKSHLCDVSDKIWEYAELGLQEFKSSTLLANDLERHGFKVELGVAGMKTAIVATYGEGKPIIGIMGEYDALSGLSQEAIPEKKPIIEGAPGHGCGHNIHGSSGMGAAVAVSKALEAEKIKGTIKFFGCPAEETVVGKIFMVRDGVFKGIDAIFSHHPGTMNAARLRSSNALNSVKFEFSGLASHAGGTPYSGRSALDAIELMNVGVNFMREHVVQEARIHYVIEKGGLAPNVVPAYARSWYFVRAPNRGQVEQIYQWILKIAKGAALMTETTHQYRLLTGCYNLLPLESMANLVVENMKLIGSPTYTMEERKMAKAIQEKVPPQSILNELRRSKRPDWQSLQNFVMDRSIPDPWGQGEVMGGSTDVGDVSWQVPTIEFNTATWVLGIPGHSWQIVAMGKSSIAHKSLVFAAKTMASCVLDTLTNPALLKKIKREFNEVKQGVTYVSPLNPDQKPPFNQFPS